MCYHCIGSHISDLEWQGAYFSQEVQSWTYTGITSNGPTTTCAGNSLLGGYNVMNSGATFKRTFSKLPPHDFVVFKISIWRIDSIDNNDGFRIKIDKTSYNFVNMEHWRLNQALCGQSWNDAGPLDIVISKVHTASNITIEIISLLDQNSDDESFGIRDIKLEFRYQFPGEKETCTYFGLTWPVISPGVGLACPIGSYNTNRGCQNCNNSCQICVNNTLSGCLSCNKSYIRIGNSCEPCHSTCSTCNDINEFNCTSCQSGYFLHIDGTCRQICIETIDVPLGKCNYTAQRFIFPFGFTSSYCVTSKRRITSSFKYCDATCPDGEYLYRDGTCLDLCSGTHLRILNTPILICDFHCNTTGFFFQNGSCINDCKFPFVQRFGSVGESFCDWPCSLSEFVYPDGECTNSCPNPFIAKEISIFKYCNDPCPGSYYLVVNKTCTKSCISPNIPRNTSKGSFCDTIEQVSEGVKAMAAVAKNLISSTAASTGGMAMLGVDPTTAVAFMTVLQNFYYLLFFNVRYPANVEMLLGSFGIVKLNFLPNPLEILTEEIPDVSSPKNFYKNGYTGLFLNSAAQSLTLITLIGLLYPVSLLNSRVIRFKSFLKYAFVSIYNKLRLKTFLRIFLMLYSEFLISSLLQMIAVHQNLALVNFSIFLAYVFFLVCLSLPYILLYFIMRKEANLNLFKRLEPIIEDYDLTEKMKRAYGFFILKKRFIHCVAIVSLYYVPIVQGLLPFLCNLAILYLLVKHKPHQRFLLNLFESLYEIGYLALHSCVMSLAYLDMDGKHEVFRETIGWLIIVSIILILIVSFVQIWIENITNLKRIYFIWKKKFKTKEKSSKGLNKTRRIIRKDSERRIKNHSGK